MSYNPDKTQHQEKEGPIDRQVSVVSDCQAIYRIVPKDETEETARSFGASIFHVPDFPSLDSINPSEKLYEKRDEVDADLVELLLCLDWKVNLLIKTLAPQRDETLYPHRALIREISITNLKIITSNPLSIGTVLAFHFVLPILPFKELILKGDVVEANTKHGAYGIALHTHFIKELEREHLIRYVVRRQFQIKREDARSL